MRRTMTGLSALIFLAGCAGSARDLDRRPPTGFETAARLADQGRHADALPILRCIAGQGDGFEIAQFLAGRSALALSQADTTPALMRDALRVEGLDRLVSAGNAGWPAAQAALAEAFASVPTEEALMEAAFWARLYRRNARERSYGLDRLDNAVEADIEARLDPAAMMQARDRTAAFQATPLTRETMTPDCARHVRSGRGGGSGVSEGPGPRGGGNGPPRGRSERTGGPIGPVGQEDRGLRQDA
ncbi:hypothetical protein [Maricaulis sp.]|uniref:hypothetical protein n=1 Tax=Maricaulis sp. TaxID=1486257 RepID=UPI0025C557EA|nr:hypothetical protein [Maricaulis sp.]